MVSGIAEPAADAGVVPVSRRLHEAVNDLDIGLGRAVPTIRIVITGEEETTHHVEAAIGIPADVLLHQIVTAITMGVVAPVDLRRLRLLTEPTIDDRIEHLLDGEVAVHLGGNHITWHPTHSLWKELPVAGEQVCAVYDREVRGLLLVALLGILFLVLGVVIIVVDTNRATKHGVPFLGAIAKCSVPQGTVVATLRLSQDCVSGAGTTLRRCLSRASLPI